MIGPSALTKNDPLWCAHHNGSLLASAEGSDSAGPRSTVCHAWGAHSLKFCRYQSVVLRYTD